MRVKEKSGSCDIEGRAHLGNTVNQTSLTGVTPRQAAEKDTHCGDSGPVSTAESITGNARTSLPTDRLFEFRFESIGGLGAHAAGQILATASVLGMGMNGAHFSSYGSEKKGSVVRSYIRLGPADKPIRSSAPVAQPDVIVVFHAALLNAPATYAGLRSNGTLIYAGAAEDPIPDAFTRLPKSVRIVRVDALRIAIETKSRPNAVFLGTLSAQFPFLREDIVLDYLTREFARKHPAAVASNEKAFRRGATEAEVIPSMGTGTEDLPPVPSEPLWGYSTAPIGGVLPTPGNSAWNDLSTARMGMLPVLDSSRCIHCAMCDMVCPDFCFVWSEKRDGNTITTHLEGIDYRYCKGCMRCIESCPTGALTQQPEHAGMASQLRVPLFPDLIP